MSLGSQQQQHYNRGGVLSPTNESIFSDSTDMGEEVGVGGLPTETQLLLLCLDYLRDLRRSFCGNDKDLSMAEGIDADWLSVSIFALSRCFLRPQHLLHHNNNVNHHSAATINGTNNHQASCVGNDAWIDRDKVNVLHPGTFNSLKNNTNINMFLDESTVLPNLAHINREIMYTKDPNAALTDDIDNKGTANNNGATGKNPLDWHEYDDTHMSNSHRFYPLNGLASGPHLGSPLTLGEITAAGLAGLGARSRCDAERDMIKSPLFEQFVAAVRAKGFFRDPENNQNHLHDNANSSMDAAEEKRQRRAAEIYQERFRKVVGKFRTKLATKAHEQEVASNNTNNGSTVTTNLLAISAADRQKKRRLARLEKARLRHYGDTTTPNNDPNDETNPHYDHQDVSENVARHSTPNRYNEAAGIVTDSAHSTPNDSFAIQDPDDSPIITHRKQQTEESVKTSSTAASSRRDSSSQDAEDTPPRHRNHPSSQDNSPNRNHRYSIVVTNTAKKLLGGSGRTTPDAPPSNNVQEQDQQDNEEQAESLKSQGNMHMQQKNYDKAVESYTAALELSPSGPQSHVYFSNRAAALLSQKKFRDAIVDSQRSLALKPDYGKAHARLGLAHFLLGHYREAMDSYTTSLQYEPDNKSSKNYLEKATKRLAKQEKAAAEQERRRRLEEEEEQEQQEQEQQHNGNQTSAIINYDHAALHKRHKSSDNLMIQNIHDNDDEEDHLLLYQKEAEKYKMQGNQRMAERDYMGALESYTIAIDICSTGPNSHVYYSNRAAALCYLERYPEAEADSYQSLSLVPTYGKAHARLGLSRFFMGNYAGAVEAYTMALEYDPDNAASKSYLAKAKARLERDYGDPSISGIVEQRHYHQQHEDYMYNPQDNNKQVMVMMAGRSKNHLNNKMVLHNMELQQRKNNNTMADPSMMEAMISMGRN